MECLPVTSGLVHSWSLKVPYSCKTSLSSTVLVPPQLSTSSPSNDSIAVSWAPVANAVQYTLSIYKFGSNTNMKQNTSNTNLTISGLDAGSLYMIRGFAWDAEGRKGEGSLYINQTTRKKTLRQSLYPVRCSDVYITSHTTLDRQTVASY